MDSYGSTGKGQLSQSLSDGVCLRWLRSEKVANRLMNHSTGASRSSAYRLLKGSHRMMWIMLDD